MSLGLNVLQRVQCCSPQGPCTRILGPYSRIGTTSRSKGRLQSLPQVGILRSDSQSLHPKTLGVCFLVNVTAGRAGV